MNSTIPVACAAAAGLCLLIVALRTQKGGGGAPGVSAKVSRAAAVSARGAWNSTVKFLAPEGGDVVLKDVDAEILDKARKHAGHLTDAAKTHAEDHTHAHMAWGMHSDNTVEKDGKLYKQKRSVDKYVGNIWGWIVSNQNEVLWLLNNHRSLKAEVASLRADVDAFYKEAIKTGDTIKMRNNERYKISKQNSYMELQDNNPWKHTNVLAAAPENISSAHKTNLWTIHHDG